MKKQSNATKIATQTMHRFIESLLHLFILCKTKNEEVIVLKQKREELDANNEDYADIRQDKRENMKMYWLILISILGIAVDFFLSFQAVTIICDKFNLPSFLKFFLPSFLIIVEIGVSYFQAIHQRNGERSSWVTRNLQYFVLLMLFALSIFAVVFSAQMYNPCVDGSSFISFIFWQIAFQLILLIPSIMFHLWLIRNAEVIVESFAYFHYVLEHNNLTKKINKLEKENKQKHLPEFTKRVSIFIQKLREFNRVCPDAEIDFLKTIPAELITAINKVMGRNVFSVEQLPSV